MYRRSGTSEADHIHHKSAVSKVRELLRADNGFVAETNREVEERQRAPYSVPFHRNVPSQIIGT